MAIRSKAPAKKTVSKKTTVSRAKKTTVKKTPVKATAKKATARKTSTTKRASASKPKSGKLHHRVHHHVKRHIMRYIGGATALFVLTFAAQTGLSYAAAKPSTKKSSKGYLVVYSEQGKYSSATLTSNGNVKCSGAPVNKATGNAIINLSKKGKKLICDATSGSQKYTISYLGGPTTVVDVDAGYCVLAHANPAKTRKVTAKGSTCESDAKNDTVTKVGSTITVKPELAKNKKSVTGYVDINGFGAIAKIMCSGQVNLELKDASNKVVQKKTVPVKYTKPANGSAYCVAKYTLSKTTQGQTYTVQASFAGNKFFNGSMNSSVPVSVPAKTTAKKSTNNGKKADLNNGISPTLAQ